jgi:predicted enzyme related to lactoylglutathione lyase
MPGITHFSVYCDDEQRAMAFYGAVFGWRFEPWGPPGYHRILTEEGPDACQGSLTRRIEPRGQGAPNAFRCTIGVADIDATLARIEELGGRVDQPAIELPGIGRVAEFYDPEGNLACVMQYVAGDPRAVR